MSSPDTTFPPGQDGTTWRSATAARSALVRRRKLWALGVVLTIVIAAIGWISTGILEQSLKEQEASDLATILKADVAGLINWIDGQKRSVSVMASLLEVRRDAESLALLSDRSGARALLAESPARDRLRQFFGPILEKYGFRSFSVIDRNGFIVADSEPDYAGAQLHHQYMDDLERILNGEMVLGLPIRQRGVNDARDPSERPIMMFVAAPVRSPATDKVIAALSFSFSPGQDFTRMLALAQTGASGETYAFDSNAVMISQSRFDDQLREIDLLPPSPNVTSLLNLDIRAPAEDMTRGYRPTIDRGALPLTKMAASALSGAESVRYPNILHDVDGYRDYRGVEVIGAWTWLEDLEFGVATEQDLDEAFAPLALLRYTLRGLLGLLVLAGVAVFVDAVRMNKMERRMKKAIRAYKRLGQYDLQEKLGEGAMGVVYKASHVLLHRPTAIKLLPPEKSSEETVARFEREVRLTSRLTHPNTIEIYDFGRTPENTFYYAMEHIEGLDLETLVTEQGAVPASRCIYLLRQICGSLREAHGMGLVHRDIKPQNIMLCQRGAMHDVIKVLDFGLVKNLGGGDATRLSTTQMIAGTPMFISPEAVLTPSSVDARSDLYAVGMVGYYLLTGDYPFDGDSVMEVCMKHVNEVPPRLGSKAPGPVPPDLEAVIMKCLEKKPEDRYQTAADLSQVLAKCEDASSWDDEKAGQWWATFRSEHAGDKVPAEHSRATIMVTLDTVPDQK